MKENKSKERQKTIKYSFYVQYSFDFYFIQ